MFFLFWEREASGTHWTQTLDPWPLARIRCGLHCTQYRENFVLGVSLWYVGNGSEAGAFLKASTRGSLLHPAPVPSLQKAQSLSTQRLQEHAQVPCPNNQVPTRRMASLGHDLTSRSARAVSSSSLAAGHQPPLLWHQASSSSQEALFGQSSHSSSCSSSSSSLGSGLHLSLLPHFLLWTQ